jgi:IclR family transcriptional regulator, KDG regulon repressor
MKKSDTRNPTYFIQSLDRAMDILDCFSFNRKALSQGEIVQKTGLNRTTAIRFLSHLTGRGYLKYDEPNKVYRLGNRMLELGGIALSSISLRAVAAPYLTRLRNDIGHTILLAVRIEDDLVYIDKRDGKGVMVTTSEIGRRRPLHFGMLGMVLTAYLPKAEQERLLAKEPLVSYTSKSITDKVTFLRELEKVRKNGYYIGKEDVFDGLGGISAPVRDHKGEVAAALGFTMILSLLDGSGIEKEVIEKVTDTALAISRGLGYNEP